VGNTQLTNLKDTMRRTWRLILLIGLITLCVTASLFIPAYVAEWILLGMMACWIACLPLYVHRIVSDYRQGQKWSWRDVCLVAVLSPFSWPMWPLFPLMVVITRRRVRWEQMNEAS
jgi:hypothetical protein